MYGDDGHTEQVAQESAAYDAGRHARRMGRPSHSNPYKHTDGLWPEWDAGWEDADYTIPPDSPQYDPRTDTYNEACVFVEQSAAGHLFYIRDGVARGILASVHIESFADTRSARAAAERIAARWNAVPVALESLKVYTQHHTPAPAALETLSRAMA